MTAPIRDMAGLVRGLREAQEERQLATETIDEIAGLALRYTAKVLSGQKNIGADSLEGILGAVGKCLIMVDDPDAIKRVKNRWVKRKRIQSVELDQAMRASMSESEQKMLEFKAKASLSERMKQLSKLGASKGGKRRAKAMGKRARQRIAAHAARARWAKAKEQRA